MNVTLNDALLNKEGVEYGIWYIELYRSILFSLTGKQSAAVTADGHHSDDDDDVVVLDNIIVKAEWVDRREGESAQSDFDSREMG